MKKQNQFRNIDILITQGKQLMTCCIQTDRNMHTSNTSTAYRLRIWHYNTGQYLSQLKAFLSSAVKWECCSVLIGAMSFWMTWSSLGFSAVHVPILCKEWIFLYCACRFGCTLNIKELFITWKKMQNCFIWLTELLLR